MEEKQLEKWLSSVDSRHRAVLVAAKRAKQIQKGLRPYFDSKTSKVTTMALEEFVNGKADWYELSQEEIDAIRKETRTVTESVNREFFEPVQRRDIRIFDETPDTDSDDSDDLDSDDLDVDSESDPDASTSDLDD